MRIKRRFRDVRQVAHASVAAKRVEPERLHATLDRAEQVFSAILDSVEVEQVKVSDPNSLYKVSVALSSLIRARTELLRWETEQEEVVNLALERLKAEVKAALADKPQLVEQVLEVIDATATAQRGNLLE